MVKKKWNYILYIVRIFPHQGVKHVWEKKVNEKKMNKFELKIFLLQNLFFLTQIVYIKLKSCTSNCLH